MLKRAIEALDIDPAASFLVGDRLSDIVGRARGGDWAVLSGADGVSVAR